MVGSQSFGINKLLEDYNGGLTVSDIQGDYDYSFICGYYSDIMLNLRYITKANAKRTNYGFEIGPSIRWLLFTEKGISRTNGNNTILDKTKHAGIFNHNRYGVNGIVSRRTVKSTSKNDVFGLSLSLLLGYSFSEVFIDPQAASANAFSVGLAMGFIFE
ncbi:MAG: hypothetical protein IPH45_09015 [Bacteroidales bacterium]|nr:hypothetical protein [Bacteroidales bacterium]